MALTAKTLPLLISSLPLITRGITTWPFELVFVDSGTFSYFIRVRFAYLYSRADEPGAKPKYVW